MCDPFDQTSRIADVNVPFRMSLARLLQPRGCAAPASINAPDGQRLATHLRIGDRTDRSPESMSEKPPVGPSVAAATGRHAPVDFSQIRVHTDEVTFRFSRSGRSTNVTRSRNRTTVSANEDTSRCEKTLLFRSCHYPWLASPTPSRTLATRDLRYSARETAGRGGYE
jgi:hypothetical protein